MGVWHNIVVGSVALTLAACAPPDFDFTQILPTSGPGFVPQVSNLPFDAEGRRAYEGYSRRQNPKAFAFSPATGKTWQAWGYNSVQETMQIALSKCETVSSSQCEIYAVNSNVVWRGSTTRSAQPGLRPATSGGDPHEATTGVNIRRGPGTGHARLGVLGEGQQAMVTATEGNWYVIAMNDGSQGYVHRDFLTPASGTSVRRVDRTAQPARNSDEVRGFRAQAEGGDAEAAFELGKRYAHGIGVEQDMIEARYWLAQAAEDNHPLAAYELGLIHEFGRGVEIDLAEAARWYQVGGANGHDVSKIKAEQYRHLLN